MKEITILLLTIIILGMGVKLNDYRNTINWYYKNDIRREAWFYNHYVYIGWLEPKEVEECIKITGGIYY